MALKFEITGDNQNFISSMKQVQASVTHTSKLLEQVGGAFNIDGVINQISALSTVIRDNEIAITRSKELISEWQRQVIEAREAGDFKTLDSLQSDITEELNNLDELTKETEEYKKALDDVLGLKMSASNTPMLFNSQEEYDNAQRLKAEIADLQRQISSLRESGGDVSPLNAQLTQLQDELNNANISAAESASKLGKAGALAAEASTRYYELTSAVREQTQAVMNLTFNARQAAVELKKAVESGDAKTIDDARVKYDAFSESLTNAKLKLIEMQTEQKHFQDKMQEMAKSAQQGGSQITGLFKNIAAVAGVSFSLNQAKQFIKKVVEVRSYFQDIESSMKVFLGSAEASADFTEKLKKAAYYNMFEFSDLAKASQQMIAYGNDIDGIIPRIQQLSDIAVGTNGSLMELVDAYNRAKSTGVVDARGIQSWAVKGVVIRDVLKEMGETAVGSSISFEQLNKVIDHVTGEGGMFHNLQQEMMNNISAEIGQFQDNLDLALNEIGEKYQGVITGAIKLGSELIDNYETVGKTIMDIVVAFGLFKGALAAATAYGSFNMKVMRAMVTATQAGTAATYRHTAATIIADRAQKVWNASILANPYVAVAAALAALTFGIYKLVTAESAEAAARRKANEEMEDFKKNLDEQKSRINGYIQTIQDSNATAYEQALAMENLKKEVPGLMDKYTEAELKALDLAEAQKSVNEEMEKVHFEHAKKELEKWKKALNDAQDQSSLRRLNILDYFLNPLIGVANIISPEKIPEKGILSALFPVKDVKEMQERVNIAQQEVDRFMKFYNKQADEAKPIEIRVKEANDNLQEKQRILDFYDEAISLAHEVESATNEADYTEARNKFDEYVSEIGKEVESLKEQVDKNPMDMKLRLQAEEKTRMYNELVSLKNSWRGIFASPIPVWFSIKYTDAKTEADAAKSGQRKGMHFVKSTVGKDVVNGERGYWEANKEELSRTPQQWLSLKKKEYEDAQKELRTYLNSAGKKNDAENQKAIKDLKNKVQAAKQAYEEAGGSTKGGGRKSGGSGNQNRAKELADRKAAQIVEEQKYQDELDKLQQEAKEARLSATIVEIQNDGERERAERKAQHEKNLRDIKDQEKDIYKTIYEQRKKAYETANKDKYENTEEGRAGWRGLMDAGIDKLTSKEKEYYNVRYSIMKSNLDKENSEYSRYILQRSEEEAQAMLDYLKEYGSMQAKVEAITAEYDKKIEEEQDVFRKASLEKQKEAALKNLDFENFQESIDWEVVFGNLDRLSEEKLADLKGQLRKALDVKELTPENAQVLSEKILEIESEISERANSWSNIIPALKERERITRNVARLEEEAGKALIEAEAKRSELNKTVDFVQSNIKNVTGVELSVSQLNGNKEDILSFLGLKEDSEAYRQVSEDLDKLKVAAEESATAEEKYAKAKTKYDVQNDILKGFKGSGLKGGISDIMASAVEGAGGGMLGQLKVFQANVNSMADFTDKIGLSETHFGEAVHGFADGVNGFMGAIQSLASGDVFGALNGIIDGLRGYGKVLTAVFGVNWSGGNEKEVAETTERLTKSNIDLGNKIDALKERLESSFGSKAIGVYKDAMSAQEKQNAQVMEILKTQMGYHSAHHSNEYYIDNNKIREYNSDAQAAFLAAGVRASTLTGLSSIYNLTPEQLKAIRDFAPDLWHYLTEAGKYDKSEYWDSVVEQAGKTAELTKQIQQTLTTTSEDNVFSGFLEDLLNLANGSEDVFNDIADNWREMVNKMVVNNLVGASFQGRLKEWYGRLANTMERHTDDQDPSGLNTELEKLRKEYEGYVKDAQKEVEALRQIGLIQEPESSPNSQSATVNAIQNVTQDQAEELIGRITAIQIGGEQRNYLTQQIADSIANMANFSSMNSIYLTELRNIALSSNGYLEDISKHTKNIYIDFSSKIDELRTEVVKLQ